MRPCATASGFGIRCTAAVIVVVVVVCDGRRRRWLCWLPVSQFHVLQWHAAAGFDETGRGMTPTHCRCC